MSKFGKYRPVHFAGFGFMAIGTGTFILFDENSGAALYVCLQLVTGLGSGLVLGALLPAVQAALTEKDTASSTATWSFIRTFGTIWGVSVPAAIFNSRSNDLSNRIDDPSVRALIANGQAYSHATSAVLLSLETNTRDQVISVFTDSLKLVWIVAVVVAGVSFFAIFAEREIGLRDDLSTSYGLNEPEKRIESANEEKMETNKH